MANKRHPYNFGSHENVRRFRHDMRMALAERHRINNPYGRPLVPIPELDAWADRARDHYQMTWSEEGGTW